MKPRALFIAGDQFFVPPDVEKRIDLARLGKFKQIPKSLPPRCVAVIACKKLTSHDQFEKAHALAEACKVPFVKVMGVSGLRDAALWIVAIAEGKLQREATNGVK